MSGCNIDLEIDYKRWVQFGPPAPSMLPIAIKSHVVDAL
jgi:hypothetical protein